MKWGACHSDNEIKFWAWKCVRCGNETVQPLSGKLPGRCTTLYCGGTDFLKVGEGRTEAEARAAAQKKRGVNL
jgi:hypothetical protein